MGDGCKILWEEQRRKQEAARHVFSRIAPPSVGDALSVRTVGAEKTFVCVKRDIIACLAPGDRVVIFTTPTFRKTWKLARKPGVVEATFGHRGTERDFLVIEAGPAIPVRELSRKIGVKVLSIVERHEEPIYDETAARETLDQLQHAETLVTA